MRRIEIQTVDFEPTPGPAPMLQWIEIKDLVVDEAYQRDLTPRNWAAIRRIAGDFKWSRFSPVFCAPVEGGAFAIIDGQHRTHAAAMCGFTKVPCQVVQMERQEQAEAFAAVNGAVTKITGFNLFRAELASGDPVAGALVAMAAAAGCQIATGNASAKTKKPGTIYFLSNIKELHAKHGAVLGRALTIMRSAEMWDEDVDLWGGHICPSVLQAMCERAELLDRPGFKEAFEEFDVYTEIERLADIRKRRLQAKLAAMTGKEALRLAMLDHLDKRFPQQVAA